MVPLVHKRDHMSDSLAPGGLAINQLLKLKAKGLISTQQFLDIGHRATAYRHPKEFCRPPNTARDDQSSNIFPIVREPLINIQYQ